MTSTLTMQMSDLATEAYLEWRVLSAAVDDTYEAWTQAPREEAALAFRRYRRALDQEERASLEYAFLVGGLAA
jgi:hypothetical protein